jgi:hypothetical protein
MPEQQVQAWQMSADALGGREKVNFRQNASSAQKIGSFLIKLTNFHLTSMARILAAIDSPKRHTMAHKGSLQIQNLRKMSCDEFAMLASC